MRANKISSTPLGLFTNFVQSLAGVLLPGAAAFFLLLCHDKAVLLPRVNSRRLNVFTAGVIAVLVVLSITLTASVLFSGITERQILAILIGGSVLALATAAGVKLYERSHRMAKISAVAAEHGAPESWRMPPLDTLPPAQLTLLNSMKMERTQRRGTAARVAIALVMGLAFARAFGADLVPGPEAERPAAASESAVRQAGNPPVAEDWAVHGQMTNVTQWHRRFRSPYAGTNSLEASGRTEETTDATIYAGVRLWRGVELWLNPELDQGFGLSNTVGVAGFPSGEAYKIGANTPYLRLPRAFLRQTIALGTSLEPVAAAANQLASAVSADRVVLTVGKFSATDIFDANSYAHDPRTDFLNWAIIDAGSFDYAADAWGFTYGGAAEWTFGQWTWRGGVFQLSKVPNGKVTGVDFGQYMLVAEGERRYAWNGLAGKVKLLGFMNRGRMAAYDDAVSLGRFTGEAPDVSQVRRRRSRFGATLNVEQAFSSDIGAFARLGLNDGTKEAYEFTEINNSVSTGLSIRGSAWHRPDDVVGLAAVTNGLSSAARNYFAAGGIGILIGDGRLNYAREQIAEAYYALRLDPHHSLGLNVQRIVHPAYNRDRGPVTVVGFRAHAEF